MGKQQDVIDALIEENQKLGLGLDDELIAKVAKGLGPVLYNPDASTVACSQSGELETVRENFLKKKLGLSESDEVLDEAIKEVCEKMGSSNRNKYRALFYALLTKKFGKESVYA